tara:strand:+ start:223 stop:840 length:618 start_codon:yes stop_codon:yes gene_type:complete
MILKIASYKAVKYACLNFHYAESVPVNTFGYSVFNDENKWCGVVLFGLGASPYVSKSLGMNQGQAAELVRMALNGKQKNVSSILSVAIRLFKKQNPLVKILFSYADIDQNHKGTIYQATNWFFIGNVNENKKSGYIVNGKKIHARVPNSKGIKNNISEVRKYLDSNATEYISKGKRKYIYPLYKSLVPFCKSLAKPYPKSDAKEV